MKCFSFGGHYIIPQSQFWHQATQLSTTNGHFISDLDFPNSHIFSFIWKRPLNSILQNNSNPPIWCDPTILLPLSKSSPSLALFSPLLLCPWHHSHCLKHLPLSWCLSAQESFPLNLNPPFDPPSWCKWKPSPSCSILCAPNPSCYHPAPPTLTDEGWIHNRHSLTTSVYTNMCMRTINYASSEQIDFGQILIHWYFLWGRG